MLRLEVVQCAVREGLIQEGQDFATSLRNWLRKQVQQLEDDKPSDEDKKKNNSKRSDDDKKRDDDSPKDDDKKDTGSSSSRTEPRNKKPRQF